MEFILDTYFGLGYVCRFYLVGFAESQIRGLCRSVGCADRGLCVANSMFSLSMLQRRNYCSRAGSRKSFPRICRNGLLKTIWQTVSWMLKEFSDCL